MDFIRLISGFDVIFLSIISAGKINFILPPEAKIRVKIHTT